MKYRTKWNYEQMIERRNEWMNDRTNEWMNKWTNELTNEWKNEYVVKKMKKIVVMDPQIALY